MTNDITYNRQMKKIFYVKANIYEVKKKQNHILQENPIINMNIKTIQRITAGLNRYATPWKILQQKYKRSANS